MTDHDHYVHDLEARVAQLEAERRTDPITGAGNLLAFREACDLWGDSGVAILFDATNLKLANTELGHFGADQVLAQIGTVLREGWDLSFRYGGDEFAVVLPACSVGDARAVRDRIEAAVGQWVLACGAVVRLVGAVAVSMSHEGLQAADARLERRKSAWKRSCGQGVFAR